MCEKTLFNLPRENRKWEDYKKYVFVFGGWGSRR